MEAEAKRAGLEQQIKEHAENQGSYREFCAQLHLLPDSLRERPAHVEEWLGSEIVVRTSAVTEHVRRVGLLTTGWRELLELRAEPDERPMRTRLLDLESEREKLQGETAAA